MSSNLADGDQAYLITIDYLNGLYSYALALTHNHVDAEDLVHETYVRAMQARPKLQPESNIKSWLFTILRNLWLNQLRKRRNGPKVVEIDLGNGIEDHIVETSQGSHELYAHGMESEQVRAAIRELPTNLREIVLLREFEELSYQEVAGVLDCPIGTVMSRLSQARTKLRTLLSKKLKGTDSFRISSVRRPKRDEAFPVE